MKVSPTLQAFFGVILAILVFVLLGIWLSDLSPEVFGVACCGVLGVFFLVALAIGWKAYSKQQLQQRQRDSSGKTP